MPCETGESIKWVDFYELGERLDLLQATLDIPPLARVNFASTSDEPWAIPGTQFVDWWQWFSVDVTGSAAAITASFLGDSTMNVYTFPSYATQLNNMSDSTTPELRFVSDADNCWCKTVFEVIPAAVSSGRRLHADGSQAASSQGCCQTIDVPEVGSNLDYDQNFIPAGWVANNLSATAAPGAPFFLDIPKCEGVADGCRLYFAENSPGSGNYELRGAGRRLTGKLTWVIRKAYMDKLAEAVDTITSLVGVRCGKLGVADYYGDGLCAEYAYTINTGCTAQVNESTRPDPHFGIYRLLLNYAWGSMPGVPGTLSTDDCLEDCYPWNPCGEEETCADGVKVYCQTLKDFETIVTKMEEGLGPWVNSVNYCCINPGVSLEVARAIGIIDDAGDENERNLSISISFQVGASSSQPSTWAVSNSSPSGSFASTGGVPHKTDCEAAGFDYGCDVYSVNVTWDHDVFVVSADNTVTTEVTVTGNFEGAPFGGNWKAVGSTYTTSFTPELVDEAFVSLGDFLDSSISVAMSVEPGVTGNGAADARVYLYYNIVFVPVFIP